ncbi:alcohol dehydrogenase catalytic domain-containing protein [Phaeobacter sp. HF9A]|uniref:zinc-binding dehydrogenase n=1 Tax=Phaeobacter sp. HF9A TaxID=2721561 RepID=UPI00143221CD|nr:alcohol dehydrogenase catalytic domain-containing protein [Phaeobacter sp. HF9A]NIZ12332.1 alcohol dehydrogenase catalytic domain-containing protein [Phaeobacter sp. HF9A]
MKRMKAIRCHGFGGQHQFESAVEVPSPGAGEVLVRVDASGICAADRAMWDASGPWQLSFPFTPGHEFTGTVVALGEGAAARHGLAVGDRAIAELNITYGNDFFRQRGLYHLSDSMDVLGATLDGGWAEYMIYPADAVIHKVPDSVSNRAACYTEPLANAIHGVQRADIGFEDVVVVAGAGPIGMGMIQAARLKTPRKLILINPGKAKRDLALTLGADLAFHPDDPELRSTLDRLTGGRGADVFLEASGRGSAFLQGLDLIRKAGRMVVFGVYKEAVPFDLNILGEFKELDLRGGHLAPFTYATALDLMARGLIDGEACVTHAYPLEEFEAAITRTPAPDEVQIKVIFEPHGKESS